MKRTIALTAAATLVCGLALGSLGAQSLGQEMASNSSMPPLDAGISAVEGQDPFGSGQLLPRICPSWCPS